jgi:signal peptidase I
MEAQHMSPFSKRVAGAKKNPHVEFDIGREAFEWSGAMVNAIVTVVLVFAFVCGVFRVDGDSMLPTLVGDEFMVVSRLFYTPKTGDIVVFSKMDGRIIDPNTGRESPLVKRVIGTPGDTVKVDYTENAVYVNDKKLDESYLAPNLEMRPPYYSSSAHQTPDIMEITVSPGCVFVVGDNRNHSRDSRDPSIGEIDQRYILGRLLLRVYPPAKFGPVR